MKRQQTLRHQRRRFRRYQPTPAAKSVPGDGDDRGKFWRCRFCGFVCDIERDALSQGEYGGDGVETSAGPPVTITVSSGCPMCGSLNWK